MVYVGVSPDQEMHIISATAYDACCLQEVVSALVIGQQAEVDHNCALGGNAPGAFEAQPLILVVAGSEAIGIDAVGYGGDLLRRASELGGQELGTVSRAGQYSWGCLVYELLQSAHRAEVWSVGGEEMVIYHLARQTALQIKDQRHSPQLG